MSVGKNIKKFRKKSGLTQVELANKANISRSYLGDVENERYNVSLDVLGKISKALNVDTSILLNEDFELMQVEQKKQHTINQILKGMQSLTDDEGYFFAELKKDIFEIIIDNLWMAPAFHNSSDHKEYEKQFKQYFATHNDFSIYEIEEMNKLFNEVYNYRTVKSVLDYNNDSLDQFLISIQGLIKNNTQDSQDNLVKIPLLGQISAGQPIDRIEYIEGYELVESETLRGRQSFSLRVKGDSMIGDGIFNGDTVIVVEQNEVTSSDIAVVAVNGYEATLKRVKCEKEMCMLIPSNSLMQPILVPAKEVKILGKVIQARRNFE